MPSQQKPSRYPAEEHEQGGVDTLGEQDSCYGKGGYAGDGVEVRAVVGVDAGCFADCVDACQHESDGDWSHALLHRSTPRVFLEMIPNVAASVGQKARWQVECHERDDEPSSAGGLPADQSDHGHVRTRRHLAKAVDCGKLIACHPVMKRYGFMLHLWQHGAPTSHREQGEEAKDIQEFDEITHGFGFAELGRHRMIAIGAMRKSTTGRDIWWKATR